VTIEVIIKGNSPLLISAQTLLVCFYFQFISLSVYPTL